MTTKTPQISLRATLFLVFAYFVYLVSSEDCTSTGWSHSDKPCPKGYNEIYKDIYPKLNQSSRTCCLPGTESETNAKRQASNCLATKCLSSTSDDLCSTLRERYINGKKLNYEEVLRESCIKGGGSGQGALALCCQPNSSEGLLLSTFGSEVNEFPHMAKLKNGCGGTVYSKRFVITAAHCVVDSRGPGLVKDPSSLEVILGSNIADIESQNNTYQVKRIIPHGQYSRLANHSEFAKKTGRRFFNDISLLELTKDINFGDSIKALEIAPKDFDPFKHAENSVIVGWGTTDTLASAVYLQKANFVLRKDTSCFSKNTSWWGHYRGMENQLLCVGGVMEGKWSYTAGAGDSGGPAICRKENGHPVLCGVTSFGGDDENCTKNSVEAHCPPSVYAEVAHFHDWIKKHAGQQDPKTLYKPILYGQNVPNGKYEHQVHITSDSGKSCGGTLVAPDVVITAAQCIVKSDGKAKHSGLKVTTNIVNLSSRGSTFKVTRIEQLPGFKRSFPIKEPVNIEKQGDRVVIADNYYSNDLAVLRLDGNVSINPSKLPTLPDFEDNFHHGWELAFPRNTSRSDQLMSREFKLLDLSDCQRRMDRMSKANLNIKVDKNVLCGVETYSGGSTCDRELGGGLICRKKNGQDVLCGVQVFRLCEFSIPNGFMNMRLYGKWVKDAIKKLV